MAMPRCGSWMAFASLPYNFALSAEHAASWIQYNENAMFWILAGFRFCVVQLGHWKCIIEGPVRILLPCSPALGLEMHRCLLR